MASNPNVRGPHSRQVEVTKVLSVVLTGILKICVLLILNLKLTSPKKIESQADVLEQSVTASVAKGIQKTIQDTVAMVCQQQFKHIETRTGALEKGQQYLQQSMGEVKSQLFQLLLNRSSSTPNSGKPP